MDKYHDSFGKFAPALSDGEIERNVAELLEQKFTENYTADVLKFLHGCIDLTSLTSIDTKENIWKLVESVNDFEGERPDLPNVAAICTYPIFVETVKQGLTAGGVKIASVAGGFPSGQTFPEVKIAETGMAVLEGADEIDTVMNLGYFLEENYEDLTAEIEEIKQSCRTAQLKVILETGALATAENIRKAAILAVFSGADFLKTSTGKGYPGATPEAVYTLCRVVKEYEEQYGTRIGIKVSGGVRTAEEAVRYYTLVKEMLGEAWLTPEYFRIGASTLREEILRKLGK